MTPEPPMQSSPTPPAAPRATLYLWILAAIVVLGVGAGLFYLKTAGANADYICTKVITSEGVCTNGSWGEWQDESTTEENNITTTQQQRTYTGTRSVNKTLTYLSGRTTCAAGYTQGSNGTWNAGWSGFHGGSVSTTESACQITQTQTLVTTQRSGGSTVRRSLTNVVVNTGTTTQTNTRNVGSLEELGIEDSGNGGLGLGDSEGEISAAPTLLRAGSTTSISWTATGVQSCVVTGTNGDSWNGLTGEYTSQAINERTVYSLVCPLGDGANLTADVVVNILPEFSEN